MIPRDDDLVGVTEAARLLGCSEAAVRDRERRGVLPPALRVSGRRAWRRADLLASLAARARPTAAAEEQQ